jgi:hypothetical protein
MQRKWWLSCILVSAWLWTSCGGGFTSHQAAQPCLVGAWELSNQSGPAFFNATIPPGAFEPGSTKYLGGGGSLAYIFREDGTFSLQAQQVKVRYSVPSGADLLDMKLHMEGFATSSYKINQDVIEAGPAGNSDIRFVATMGSDEMMNTQKPAEFAPLFVPPYTKARFVCSADKLSLEILNLPGSNGSIEFSRFVAPPPNPAGTSLPTP